MFVQKVCLLSGYQSLQCVHWGRLKSTSLKNTQTHMFWRFGLHMIWPYIGTFDILKTVWWYFSNFRVKYAHCHETHFCPLCPLWTPTALFVSPCGSILEPMAPNVRLWSLYLLLAQPMDPYVPLWDQQGPTGDCMDPYWAIVGINGPKGVHMVC